MDAHYDFQIRQQHQQSTNLPFTDQREFGSGAMGAFAMRVAMPLMKKYVLPVAKEFGKNLVSSFVPEFANIISGKKRTRKAVRDVLKHSANKTIAKATGHRGGATGAGAVGGPGRRAKRHERAGDRAPSRRKSVKDGNKSSVAKEVLVKKSPAKRSRSVILSKINFS